MRALLVANSSDADPGFVGERFRHHGWSFTECIRERPEDWPGLDGHDLVVALGSEWSVYWDHIEGEVAAEAALVRDAHDRGVPLYGICYGSQIFAHALGGHVRRSPVAEIGWSEVRSDVPEIATGPWMQWHYDVVDVPPGATELARSDVGPQAYRLGRTFATQFHPEATETIVRRWAEGAGAEELRRIGSSSGEMMEATTRSVTASRPAAERLVDWYLETVVGAAPATC